MRAIVGRKAIDIGLLGIALCLAGLFATLGIWQLNRAAEKRADFYEFEGRGAATRIVLGQSNTGDAEALWGYRAEVAGRFIGPSIILDNQTHRGRAGYLIYTVFALDSLAEYLLVNRGWIAAEADRSRAPQLHTPDTNLRLPGRLSEPPETGLRLSGSDRIERLAENIWRVQHIDYPALSAIIGEELLPITLLLDEDAPAGFVREWSPPGSDEDMHLGYAFQWFALAVTVLIVSVAVMVRSYWAGRQ